MNAATRLGIRDHAMAEHMEKFAQRLERLGYTKEQAQRGATCLTFFALGESPEQAWEDTDELMQRK